jgi:hypothetical protein
MKITQQRGHSAMSPGFSRKLQQAWSCAVIAIARTSQVCRPSEDLAQPHFRERQTRKGVPVVGLGCGGERHGPKWAQMKKTRVYSLRTPYAFTVSTAIFLLVLSSLATATSRHLVPHHHLEAFLFHISLDTASRPEAAKRPNFLGARLRDGLSHRPARTSPSGQPRP